MNVSRSPDFSGMTVRLPVGLWVEDVRHREVSLRALNGLDEETIGEASVWTSPAARVTALLAATVTRIGTLAPIEVEHIRALTVLDRDVLLIALRQSLSGDRIQSTIVCPNDKCGKPIDLDFRLSDLPVPDRADDALRYEFAVDGRKFAYRLPNGGDQEAAAGLAGADVAQAEQIILRLCVENFDALAVDQVAALQEEMAHRDPQLATEFDAHCPECGRDFGVHFDIQDFLLREISGTRLQLYRQVHTLAWYYHWSEAEILAMPFQKRHIYLNLLSDLVSDIEGAQG